jgi:excinuclease ABC subunit C
MPSPVTRHENVESAAEDASDDAFVAGSLAHGVEVIAAQVATLPSGPGVYRMSDVKGNALYVGKAKSLKKRVAAYTRPDRLPTRIQRMIAGTAVLEVITTHTEVEALLLESNLIKGLRPRYNITLRDDKSYPFILLRSDHAWPQLLKHRGAQKTPGEYFGPFASAGAVNRTLSTLQRAFPLRSCSDNIFVNRTRPCLQYQIKRCTAPCVARIDSPAYGEIVEQARDFLAGKSHDIQRRLASRMQDASDRLAYETAAIYRDRIRALAEIQAQQDVNVRDLGAADIIALVQEAGAACVQVFFFRAGQNYGNRTFFPDRTRDRPAAEVMAAFIGQFYADKTPPETILVSHLPRDDELLAEALSHRAGRKVAIACPARGAKRKVVERALTNATEALGRRMAESSAQRRLLEGVARVFDLEAPPGRIEVYDNSHISGRDALGAMIVAGPEGFVKSAYRRFNIKDTEIAPGDDYAMLREVLQRRFTRALKEDPDREAWPDLVLIDGGPGQLSAARQVFADLGIDDVPFAAIAKGPDRNAGREHFYAPDREPFSLPPNDPVLYFLQRLRDEAHRFVIGAHRSRRERAIGQSPLDEIPGIGSRRKRALLHRFGSAADVARAGLADLELVDGISKTVARRIYDHFHPDG